MSTAIVPDVESIEHLDFDMAVPCESSRCHFERPQPNRAALIIAAAPHCPSDHLRRLPPWPVCRACWDADAHVPSWCGSCLKPRTRDTAFRIVRVLS